MGLDRNQIADHLRSDIASGKYQPGERIPGYRQLAQTLGAAPNTVGEAVRLLAAEGLVSTRDKSGTVVLPPGERDAPDTRLAAARDELREVQSKLRDTRDTLGVLETQVADALAKLAD